MVWEHHTHSSHYRNPTGSNQHGGLSIPFDRLGEFEDLLRNMLKQGLKRQQMIRDLYVLHGWGMSERTLHRWIVRLDLPTPRHVVHSEEEVARAVVEVVGEDLTASWGRDRVLHKVRLEKDMPDVRSTLVRPFLVALDEHSSRARAPRAGRRLHHSSLYSIGPGEEWSGDGHDKLARMEMPIWGLRDKATRRTLGLWVVPNSRLLAVPATLFLHAARTVGGIPVKLTLDKGSEGGQLGLLQTQLRHRYAPDLDHRALPPFAQIKSVFNITIERSWRYLYENQLLSILNAWEAGAQAGIYHGAIPLEYAVARWLWAKVVQQQLDRYVEERNAARIRKQPRSHLPTGDSPNRFWHDPESWGLVNVMIPVPATDIDELIEEHTPPGLFQFVSDEMELLCTRLYTAVGSPSLSILCVWSVYSDMLQVYNEHHV